MSKRKLDPAESAYWNGFYAGKHPDLEVASTFARWVIERLRPGQTLFELGCGNGRDALFFADQGLAVIACDRSEVAISTLSERPDLARFKIRPVFQAGDMSALDDSRAGKLDAVYSRFTLHAVTADEASAALAWAHRNLAPGGQLMIEVRSVLGSLYGKGTPVPEERDAFIHDGHYRRFVRKDELEAELLRLGFTITASVEAAHLAVYKDDDPVVIRIVAAKAG